MKPLTIDDMIEKEYGKEIHDYTSFHLNPASLCPKTLEETLSPEFYIPPSTEDYKLCPEYDIIHEKYHQIIRCIFFDMQTSHELNTLTTPPDDDRAALKKKRDFINACKLFCQSWIKSAEINIETYRDFLWELFNIFEQQSPAICYNAFPLVVFILIDHFYMFADCCDVDYRHGKSSPINAEQTATLQERFNDIIKGQYEDDYLFSLLSANPSASKDNAIDNGKKIMDGLSEMLYQNTDSDNGDTHTSTKDSWDTAIDALSDDPYHIDEDIIRKKSSIANVEENKIRESSSRRYQKFQKINNNQQNKRSQRKQQIYSSYIENYPSFSINDRHKPFAIPLGESMINFFNFLKLPPQEGNGWEKYINHQQTLYLLNQATGWINALLILTRKEDKNNTPMFFTDFSLPCTYYYVITDFIPYLDSYYEKKLAKVYSDNIELRIISIINSIADDIEDNNSLLKWYKDTPYLYQRSFSENANAFFRDMEAKLIDLATTTPINESRLIQLLLFLIEHSGD